MLSLDQVRLLENHVEKAVGKISSLTAENERLRSQLSTLQERVRELEGFVSGFKDDQGKIEAGILNALEQLGALENTITSETVREEVPPAAEPQEETSIAEPETVDGPAGKKSVEPDDPVQGDGQIDIF